MPRGGQSAVPSFILKKLYTKESLRNTESGFEFRTKNTWSPGSLIEISSLEVDGQDKALENVTVMGKNDPIKAFEISEDNPLHLSFNQEVTFRVEGEQLASGPHKIVLTVLTKQAGELKIPISDSI